MNHIDWLLLAEVSNLKSQYKTAAQDLINEANRRQRQTESNARGQVARAGIIYEHFLNQKENEYQLKFLTMQKQLSFLIAEVEKKNAIIRHQASLLEKYMPKEELTTNQPSLEDAEVIVESYLFLESFLDEHYTGENDNDVINGKTMKEWKSIFNELSNALPSGDILDQIIIKLSSQD